MQITETMRLRAAWGDQPCDHPELEAEFYLGLETGDQVCTTCGEAFWNGVIPEKAPA